MLVLRYLFSSPTGEISYRTLSATVCSYVLLINCYMKKISPLSAMHSKDASPLTLEMRICLPSLGTDYNTCEVQWAKERREG